MGLLFGGAEIPIVNQLWGIQGDWQCLYTLSRKQMNYLDLLKPDSCTIGIAEAGINHDGDLNTALRMIDVAALAL